MIPRAEMLLAEIEELSFIALLLLTLWPSWSDSFSLFCSFSRFLGFRIRGGLKLCEPPFGKEGFPVPLLFFPRYCREFDAPLSTFPLFKTAMPAIFPEPLFHPFLFPSFSQNHQPSPRAHPLSLPPLSLPLPILTYASELCL